MGNVIKELIGTLEKRFEWRSEGEEAESKADMIEAFSAYSDEFLGKVAKDIRMTRTFRGMPTVGEINKVIARMAVEPGGARRPTSATYTYPDWSPYAIDQADKLIQCDLGKEAAREGWIVGLHDYCRKNGRLPGRYDIGAMIESAEFVAKTAAGAFPLGVMHKALQKLGDAFLEKRERLARLALGEEAEAGAEADRLAESPEEQLPPTPPIEAYT